MALKAKAQYNNVVTQLHNDLWSIRKILNKGPYRHRKLEGGYDAQRDRIVFIRAPTDYSGHGKPFWSVSDSDDCGLLCYGSAYLQRRAYREALQRQKKLTQRVFAQAKLIECIYASLLQEIYRPPPRGGSGYRYAQDDFHMLMG